MACGQTKEESTASQTRSQKITTQEFRYSPPAVPLTITDQRAAIEWMSDNYWRDLPTGDSSIIGSAGLQEAFGMWVMTIRLAPIERSSEAINKTYHTLEKNKALHTEFLRLGEGYLGDPNSELRNDSLFLALLDYMIGSDALSDVEKIRPTELRKLTLKNQVGTRAADLSWVDIEGKKSTLYGDTKPYKILLFYSPGCESCAALFAQINKSPELESLFKERKLSLIALYDEGDEAAWRDYAKNFAPQWVNGMLGEDFVEQQPYAIRATPSLYLLGEGNKVLVRDGANIYELLRALAAVGAIPASESIIE